MVNDTGATGAFPSSSAGSAESSGGFSASSSSAGAGDPSGKIDRLAKTAHEKIDQMADKAEPTRERLHGGVDQAAAAMKARADKLERVQDEWITSMRDCVRDHPIASIATALAVGMLIDRLLSSR